MPVRTNRSFHLSQEALAFVWAEDCAVGSRYAAHAFLRRQVGRATSVSTLSALHTLDAHSPMTDASERKFQGTGSLSTIIFGIYEGNRSGP